MSIKINGVLERTIASLFTLLIKFALRFWCISHFVLPSMQDGGVVTVAMESHDSYKPLSTEGATNSFTTEDRWPGDMFAWHKSLKLSCFH